MSDKAEDRLDSSSPVTDGLAAPDGVEEPGASQVYNYLMYGLSLPERALRSTSAVVGGALNESAALLVPQAFRSSRSYKVVVEQMLDFMVRDVGGVTSSDDVKSDSNVEGFVARKTVGSFIDMAGMATLHLSPVMVLAVLSDVAYGSQAYLKELSNELKKNGLIDQNTTIDHATDLLEAVSNASSVTASAFDTPPLSVDGLRETINQTTDAVKGIDPASLLPESEVRQIWDELHEIARKEHVGMMDVSSTVTLFALGKVGTVGTGALSTVRVAGNMFDRHIFDHYRNGLTEIQDKGLYATLADSSRPYVDAVYQNFSSDKLTITEDLVTGRLIGRAWAGVRNWCQGSKEEASRDDDTAKESGEQR